MGKSTFDLSILIQMVKNDLFDKNKPKLLQGYFCLAFSLIFSF